MSSSAFLPNVALPFIGVGSIIIAWQFVIPWIGVPSYIVPTPIEIWRVYTENSALLLQNLVPTLVASVGGFLVGNALAVMVAIAFVSSRSLDLAYFPVVYFLNTIPVLALSPVIILIFGLGLAPKIAIAAMICFFPTLISMIRGLGSFTESERHLFYILSASKWEVLWKLRFPRSLPTLFSSLRIASVNAVIGAIIGEWIGSDRGIGAMIIQATFNYQSDILYACIVLSSALSIGIFAMVQLCERQIIRY